MTRVNTSKSHRSWGYHLIVDAGSCDPVAIESKDTIAAFSKEIVSELKMIAYGPPEIVLFGRGGKRGYTLVQLIETSDITAHFVSSTKDCYLDVFSCKKFDPDMAINTFKRYFNPKTIVKHFIHRQATRVSTRKKRKTE
jgi:S-adenosylmethionine/arginine decarboxylase-like enzyme